MRLEAETAKAEAEAKEKELEINMHHLPKAMQYRQDRCSIP